MRKYKITLSNGNSFVIETELSMLGIASELKNNSKAIFKKTDKRKIEIESKDVRYIEQWHEGVKFKNG